MRHIWGINKDDFKSLRDKLQRGSQGGKQMAKLSSRESIYLNMLIESLILDYPDYIEDTTK